MNEPVVTILEQVTEVTVLGAGLQILALGIPGVQGPAGSGGGGSGTSDHAQLTHLVWSQSGHAGTASRLAGFDGSGAAAYYTPSVTLNGHTVPLGGSQTLGAADVLPDQAGVGGALLVAVGDNTVRWAVAEDELCTSFNGRIGDVVPENADYTVDMVGGAAPLASPALGGTPTAPTAAPGTSTTQIATTAFVAAAVVGYVPTSRTVTAGTGLTGGGALSANITLTVAYGTTAGTSCQGNDARLADARTPTDGSVTSAKLAAGLTLPGTTRADSHYGAVAADADAATVTLDMGAADWHAVTLGGNRTVAFANVSVGQQFAVVLKQDATGGRAVTWPASVLWAGGIAPTLTTAGGKRDVIGFKRIDATPTDLGFVMGQNY